MGSATTTYENVILDSILGTDHSAAFGDSVYIGLFVTEPSDGGGGTEVAGNGYARVEVDNTDANWPPAISGEKRNGNLITFPQATGAWGDIDWYGIWDAQSGGNLILWGSLQTTKSPVAGNQPFFDVGGIVIRQD